MLDKKGQPVPTAPDTRKVDQIYNSLLLTQQREVEAKRRYAVRSSDDGVYSHALL